MYRDDFPVMKYACTMSFTAESRNHKRKLEIDDLEWFCQFRIGNGLAGRGSVAPILEKAMGYVTEKRYSLNLRGVQLQI